MLCTPLRIRLMRWLAGSEKAACTRKMEVQAAFCGLPARLSHKKRHVIQYMQQRIGAQGNGNAVEAELLAAANGHHAPQNQQIQQQRYGERCADQAAEHQGQRQQKYP